MAEKRMFTKRIIDSDVFLDMPASAQALYFHLNMRADDDGFVNNPKKIQRMVGAAEDALNILLEKRFILAFASGIIVIKHWLLHNYIRKDTYRETLYLEEKAALYVKPDGAYTDHPVDGPSTQYRADKTRIDQYSTDQMGEKPPRFAQEARARKRSYQESAAEYRPPSGPDDSALMRKLLDKQKNGG